MLSFINYISLIVSLIVASPVKGFVSKLPLLISQERSRYDLVAPRCRKFGLSMCRRRRVSRLASMRESNTSNFFDGDDYSQSSSNLQNNMSFDDDVSTLRHRLARTKVLGPGLPPESKPPQNVNIVLFYPETEHEGVHTIEFPKGSGDNILLAFEDRTECLNFALVLKDQKFFDPTPREINFKELSDYCKSIGLQVQIVPRGTNLLPPHGRVDNMNYNQPVQQYASTLERMYETDGFYDDETINGEGALVSVGQVESLSSWQ